MTIAPFKNVGDELLVRGIHGNKAAKAAEEIIASSADYDDATLAKARAILAACNAVGAQINEAAYELIAALGAAGVKARRVGSGSSAQFPLFRLSISPDQLEAALTVAETTGYVGAEKLSSGARAALKHGGRMLILMRPDETCMRVSLHWRNGPSLLPARLAPDAVDAATLNLPSALWPGGVLVCPGDVVVADGDGVIVVPRKVAKQVALYAQEVLKKDKAGRLNLYKSLGLPLDKTVK